MHVAQLALRAGHRVATAEPVVPQAGLPVALQHLAEDHQAVLGVADEAVAASDRGLPRPDPRVRGPHRLAEAFHRLLGGVEELNLHANHPLPA